MEPLEIADCLAKRFGDAVQEKSEFRGQVSVGVDRRAIRDVAVFLKDTPELAMDYLRDLCGVDWLDKKSPRFEVVYHFYSISRRHMIRVKAGVPEEDPWIDSLTDLYRGADWHERECYDMFGIGFRGHPDPRRILMPEDWEGYPLRKDYPIKGPGEDREYRRFAEMVRKVADSKEHEWRR